VLQDYLYSEARMLPTY